MNMVEKEKIETVNELRRRTGASIHDCRRALEGLDWSVNLAEQALTTPSFNLDESIKTIKQYLA